MRPMWIGGENVSGKKRISVVDPATEEVIDEVPDASPEEAHKAVLAARAAFDKKWKGETAHVRADLLHEIARRLRERSDELARLLTREGGKPLRENVDEIGWTANCFDYYAEMGRNSRGRVIPSGEPTQLNLVLKEPYGVVLCVVPWNYPLLLLSWKMAPALAAGNTVVIKPAEQTPLSTLALGRVFDCLPPGVANIVTGRGERAGAALVRDPGVDYVAFTGSLSVGKAIGKICAERVKKCHLELGGKDAFIVCEDADLDVAAKAVAWASFLNTGQVCTSAERIYVQKGVAKGFIDRLESFTRTLRVGPGLDPKTDVGPMIGPSYRNRVHSHVQDALRRGARLLAGGRKPSRLKKGFFYEPTILTRVDRSMRVMTDETFGPVCPVSIYGSLDEAIHLANDSIYGLGANIYTLDPRKVKRFYEEVQAGTVWINDPLTDNDAGPFGGYKSSGGSRELGEEGLEAFRQSKHVHWDFEQNPKPWWYPYSR